MHILKLDNPVLIRAYLETDRHWADYALGDLDPEHFQLADWHGAAEGGDLSALTMLYNGYEPPIFFAMGKVDGIGLILDRAVHAQVISLSVREEHLPVVEQYYRTEPHPMQKMYLELRDFTPIGGSAVRLNSSHAPALLELYAQGGGDAFKPEQLAWGVFYGVFAADRLVAAAGTHVVSDPVSIAALGSVMTHPDYRGQGCATLATSAVCIELIDRGIRTIGLSVGRENWPAICVYEKLGFKCYVPFYEGTAARKE